MRKILSACLSAALILSSVATAPINAKAEEIAVQNSGDSYRDEFISALLETETDWLSANGTPGTSHYAEELKFIDFNFDGKLEFIMQLGGGSMINCQGNIYYFDNGSVNRTNFKINGEINEDPELPTNLTAYYDTVNHNYKMLNEDYTQIYDPGNPARWDCYETFSECFFDGQSINEVCYAFHNTVEDDNRNVIEEHYYDENSNSLSKNDFDEIVTKRTENCINVNMSYDTMLGVDYANLSDSEKKSALERLYDSFTYDKYEYNDTDSTTDTDEKPVVLNYTAADLVNKTILEIIDIMGGEFEVGNLYDLPSGLVYIYNEEKLPGMHFYLGGDSFYDENHGGVKLDDIKNGKYPLNTIRIFGTGKLDENVSADMSYNDLTKYFGDFECQIAQFLGGSVCDEKLMFRFDSTGFSPDNPDIGVEELKEKNPKLNDIVVFPGYAPTIDTDTSSDTDTSTDTDTNSDTDTSTDTDTTSDTDTSNDTDSDKNTSSNTSSNTASKNSTTNNKTNTTATTTTTTATVATNGITNIFIFIGVFAVSSIAIIFVLKKRKEN